MFKDVSHPEVYLPEKIVRFYILHLSKSKALLITERPIVFSPKELLIIASNSHMCLQFQTPEYNINIAFEKAAITYYRK